MSRRSLCKEPQLFAMHKVISKVIINILGTSLEYRGDSALNVFGDLLSCAAGFVFAEAIAGAASPVDPVFYAPLVVFAMIEIYLLVAIRDGMGLIFLQLLSPVEW